MDKAWGYSMLEITRVKRVGLHKVQGNRMTRRRMMRAVVALVTAPLGLRGSLQRIQDRMWLAAEERHFAAWIAAEERRILYGTGEDMPMGLLDLRRPWKLKGTKVK